MWTLESFSQSHNNYSLVIRSWPLLIIFHYDVFKLSQLICFAFSSQSSDQHCQVTVFFQHNYFSMGEKTPLIWAFFKEFISSHSEWEKMIKPTDVLVSTVLCLVLWSLWKGLSLLTADSIVLLKFWCPTVIIHMTCWFQYLFTLHAKREKNFLLNQPLYFFKRSFKSSHLEDCSDVRVITFGMYGQF